MPNTVRAGGGESPTGVTLWSNLGAVKSWPNSRRQDTTRYDTARHNTVNDAALNDVRLDLDRQYVLNSPLLLPLSFSCSPFRGQPRDAAPRKRNERTKRGRETEEEREGEREGGNMRERRERGQMPEAWKSRGEHTPLPFTTRTILTQPLRSLRNSSLDKRARGIRESKIDGARGSNSSSTCCRGS